MRSLRILTLALALGAAAGPAEGSRAAAPQYVSSEPAEGAEVHKTPDEVVVRFSEPLDPGSTLAVRDECGKRLDTGQVEVSLNEMRVALERARSGAHKVRYTAVGVAGVTGSTEGTFSYSVHLGPSCRGRGHGGHAGHGGRGDGGDGGHGGRGSHGDGGHAGRGSHGDGGHDAHRGAGAHPPGTAGHDHASAAPGALHHGEPGGSRGHAGHRRDASAGVPRPNEPEVDERVASLAASPGAEPSAAGGAVLAALVAAGVIGAIGGWILRATAPRT